MTPLTFLGGSFYSIDMLPPFWQTVSLFNIAGNRYRVIAAIHFNTQSLYVRAVLTHRDYDKWRP